MMKKAVDTTLVMTLGILIVTGSYVIYAKQIPAQTCSNTGITVRGAGEILIDKWPMIEGPGMNMGGVVKYKDYPTSITLGKGISDTTKVCLEDENGSHCVALGVIRKLK